MLLRELLAVRSGLAGCLQLRRSFDVLQRVVDLASFGADGLKGVAGVQERLLVAVGRGDKLRLSVLDFLEAWSEDLEQGCLGRVAGRDRC